MHSVSKVLVDMREFRAALPNYLHAASFFLIPKTLAVADYILTPTCAIERKSISDLIGSLNSGHLHTQMVALCRQFARPILLIEFDERKPFILLEEKDFSFSNATSIKSKLCVLLLHFPQVRIIWSRCVYSFVLYE